VHTSSKRLATQYEDTSRVDGAHAHGFIGQGFREQAGQPKGVAKEKKYEGARLDHVYEPLEVANPDYSKGPSALDKAAHLFFFTEIVRGERVSYIAVSLGKRRG